MKESGGRESNLLPIIERFASKFSEATGIAVEIEVPADVHLNDGLVAETFQMVTEGLSNIRRHTEATHATIGVECDHHVLVLRIENDGTPGVEVPQFTPRSLTERAGSLNGHLSVDQRVDGGTVIRIEIPL